MRKFTFYEFMFSREPERHKYVALRTVINNMPKFPKDNTDRKTIEAAFRRFMNDTFDEQLFNQAWDGYQIEKSLMELCDN